MPAAVPSAKLREMGQKMHYAYILKSPQNARYYYGSTSDINIRLKEHNAGRVKSTKAFRPWVVHYLEQHSTKTEALKRELFFKSRSGYRWLKEKKII
jgi:putative endonuclease